MPRERRIPEELTIIDETVSTTGKYAIAFGQHFNPMICYDVVALNRVTGITTRRHYHTKDEAMTFWQEFRKEMTAPRGESEEDERDVPNIFGPS